MKFIGRREARREIYSKNGTNFFVYLWSERQHNPPRSRENGNRLMARESQWHFNPPCLVTGVASGSSFSDHLEAAGAGKGSGDHPRSFKLVSCRSQMCPEQKTVSTLAPRGKGPAAADANSLLPFRDCNDPPVGGGTKGNCWRRWMKATHLANMWWWGLVEYLGTLQ